MQLQEFIKQEIKKPCIPVSTNHKIDYKQFIQMHAEF